MIDHDRFFDLIDDFLSRELSFEAMEQFQREMEKEFFRQFYNTFAKTVELCHCVQEEQVPQELHILVIETIRQTPQVPDNALQNAPAARPSPAPSPRRAPRVIDAEEVKPAKRKSRLKKSSPKAPRKKNRRRPR